MDIIAINDKSSVNLAIDEIHRQPIILQLPSVFALLAAPTSKGAAQLDYLKARLTNKNYGTAIGSLENFIAQAQSDKLPDAFLTAKQYTPFGGAFIRLPFRDRSFQSQTIKNGMHQGLLLTGLYANLFTKIERSFTHYPPDKLWGYTNYCAPLATSCNLSGDPDGSITTMDKALAFAKSRGIRLVLTTNQSATQKGSYPVLGFDKQGVSIHRQGPYLDAIMTKVPAHLRCW